MQTDVVSRDGGVGVAHPLEHAVVVLEGPGPHPTGEDDDVGRGELLEGGVDGDPEHAVLGCGPRRDGGR